MVYTIKKIIKNTILACVMCCLDETYVCFYLQQGEGQVLAGCL